MRHFVLIFAATFLTIFALGGLALLYAYAARDEIKMPEPIQIVE